MEPESTGDDGGEELARGVAETINARAERYLRARHTRPLPFGPIARRLTRERQQRRTRYIALTTVGCATVAGVLGLWDRPKPDTPPHETLTYTVNGDPPPQGGYIAPATSIEPVLSFSDGTHVRLTTRARGRVVSLNRHGARIALDEGNANVEVAHRPGAEWFFEAGPFVITVHGTAFSLGWSSRNARLEVQMRSGVVSVTGPLSGEEIVLRAGQSLSLSLNDEGTPASDAVTGAGPGLVGPPAPAALQASASSSAGHPLDGRRGGTDWGTRLAEGQAAGIVAEARRRGLSKVLEVSASEDLAALADAARFERDEGLARRALLSQRRRFPGSGRAAEASFLLGRLDDTGGEGSARALGWYDRYLKEAPGGAYVSEALGRKMTVLERSGRQPEATRIASNYLQRFPAGTYSRAAQALVHEP